MKNLIPDRYPIFTAKAANGVGSPMIVADSNNISVKLVTSGNANMTIKFQGSLQATAPDFSAAASTTNQWDFINFADYLDAGTLTAGGTGIITGGVDVFKNILLNTDGLVWINVQISNWVAGAATAEGVVFYNQ